MTLPTELREALGIGIGDIVEFEVIGIVKKGRTAHLGGNHAPAHTNGNGTHAHQEANQ